MLPHTHAHTHTHTHTYMYACTHTRTHILNHTHTTTRTRTHTHTHTGYGRYSAFNQLNDRNQIYLRKILESSEDSGVEAVEKVKTLYTSCQDTDTIDSRGADPLLDVLKETGWPGRDGRGGEPLLLAKFCEL